MIPISGEPATIQIRIAGTQHQTTREEVESGRGLIIFYPKAEGKFSNAMITRPIISGEPEESQVRIVGYFQTIKGEVELERG
jgi:hypothetical protein